MTTLATDLTAARDGDEAAFTRLVAPHRAGLLAHCYRMLGSAHDAEDALQEALLRAWRGLPGFEGRSSLRSWLYTHRHQRLPAGDRAARRARRRCPPGRARPTGEVALARAVPRRPSSRDERPTPEAALRAARERRARLRRRAPAPAAAPARGAAAARRARLRAGGDRRGARRHARRGLQRAAARARRRSTRGCRSAASRRRCGRSATGGCARSSSATCAAWEAGGRRRRLALLDRRRRRSRCRRCRSGSAAATTIGAFLARGPALARPRWRLVPTRAERAARVRRTCERTARRTRSTCSTLAPDGRDRGDHRLPRGRRTATRDGSARPAGSGSGMTTNAHSLGPRPRLGRVVHGRARHARRHHRAHHDPPRPRRVDRAARVDGQRLQPVASPCC